LISIVKYHEDPKQIARRHIHMADKPGRQLGNPNALNPWGRMLSQWGYTYDPTTVTDTITGNVITTIINENNSTNPSTEKDIVEKHFSYGKQLGRISDALNVLISLAVLQRDPSKLQQDERHALDDFLEMYKRIVEVKGEHVSPSETHLNILFKDIQELKGPDPETYRSLIEKMRDFAEKELRD
jgi:hypothetical protein